MLDDHAASILKSTSQRVGFRAKLWALSTYALRRIEADKATTTHRDRHCPGCGEGLKIRVLAGTTIFVCPGCNWTKQFDYMMDEGRYPGQAYIPGVTAVPRGRPIVKIKADKTIELVRS